MSSNLRGALLALAAFGIYSTHDVVVKLLGGIYSPVQIVFFSALLGFPIVSILLIRDRTDGNLRPRHPWWMLLRTSCTVVTGVTCFYAFSVLSLAQTYAILFATPLLITLLAIPLLGEKVGLRRGIAVVVGLIGVLIVLRPGSQPFSAGQAAALAACCCSAMGSVVVRKIGKDERPIVLMMLPMLANFLILGAALPFVYKPMPVEHFGQLAIIAVLSLGGGLLIIGAYRRAEAVVVAPMQYSQMIWAAIFGYLIFGEEIDRYTAIGALVIMGSGLYIVLREGRANVSTHSPVLNSRARPETAHLPRPSLLMRLIEKRGPDEPPRSPQ